MEARWGRGGRARDRGRAGCPFGSTLGVRARSELLIASDRTGAFCMVLTLKRVCVLNTGGQRTCGVHMRMLREGQTVHRGHAQPKERLILVGLLERAALCRWTTAGVEAGTPHAAQWHYDWSRPWRRYRREKPSNHDSSATVLSVTCRPSCTPLGGPWFMLVS